jgi:hypothetical protein
MDLEYPHLDRVIRYREDMKGDIVVLCMSTSELLSRSPCNRKALKAQVRYCERKPSDPFHLIGQFNAVAEDLVEGIHQIEVGEHDSTHVLCHTGKGKRLSSGQNLTFSVAKDDPFEPNMRYLVEVDGSKLVFEVLEPITVENFHQQYADPVMTVYVVDN